MYTWRMKVHERSRKSCARSREEYSYTPSAAWLSFTIRRVYNTWYGTCQPILCPKELNSHLYTPAAMTVNAYHYHKQGRSHSKTQLPLHQRASSHAHHSRYTCSSRRCKLWHRLAHRATAHRHTANSLYWPPHGHTTSETARSATTPAPPPTADQTSRL